MNPESSRIKKLLYLDTLIKINTFFCEAGAEFLYGVYFYELFYFAADFSGEGNNPFANSGGLFAARPDKEPAARKGNQRAQFVTGLVEVRYIYRAFGEELKRPGEGNAKYTYGGKELDGNTNLYYFNARYYDATTGRFINVDPVQDETNWYVYCNNNPLCFKDPTGLVDVVDESPGYNGKKRSATMKRLEEKKKGTAKDKAKLDKDKKPSRYVYEYKIETPSVNGNGIINSHNSILPYVKAEAHLNNEDMGASLAGSTGGAGVEKRLGGDDENNITAKATAHAINGKLDIGINNGIPRIQAHASMLEAEGSITLNILGAYKLKFKLSGSSSILAGGAKLDLLKGIDVKIAYGCGFGVGITLENYYVGKIYSKDIYSKNVKGK